MTIKAVYNCIVCLVKAERQEKALMVVTCSQTKRAEINRTEQAELEKIEEVTAAPSRRETPSNGSLEPEGSNFVGQIDIWLTKYNFDEDMFVGNKNRKEKKSRSEKREDRYKHARQKFMVGDMTLDISRQDLHQLQEEDHRIQSLREKHPQLLVEQNGLLYYLWTPKDSKVTIELILPKQCYQTVCKLAHTIRTSCAHTIPLAGHLGRDKTIKTITRHFYWPTLFSDVAEYCHRCPQCQRITKGSLHKVPLIPLPVMQGPFERIVMDVVGPLPWSRRGNQYILVVCDYATRYPEAMALWKVDAGSVAEQLIQLFSRVDILREILFDQGTCTDFMS